MGTVEKIFKAVTEAIAMNDKMVSLASRLSELAEDVKDIDKRLIRLETIIEIAEKQQLHKKISK